MTMATEVLDTLGLKCPQHVLKIAVKAPDERLKKVFLSVQDGDGATKRIQIQF
jgi:hypothetical protein